MRQLSAVCTGGGRVRCIGHCRSAAWMQSGPTGKLRPLCGDGEALQDGQAHPGVHHLAARRQGRRKEVILSPRRTLNHSYPLNCRASRATFFFFSDIRLHPFQKLQ